MALGCNEYIKRIILATKLVLTTYEYSKNLFTKLRYYNSYVQNRRMMRFTQLFYDS